MAPSIAVTALETRLAQVFLTELVGPRPNGSYAEGDDTQVDIVLLDPDEQTDYEAYELVFTPVSDLDVTLPIARVRDTTQDTIATVEFVRESLDPNTVPFPRSAPYELIDIQDSSVPVERIVVRLPEDGARIVNDRSMPDVNCRHVIAMALVDAEVSFDDSHSYERMKDPRVLAVKERVELVADPALMDASAPRRGLVEITLRDGRKLSHFTPHAPGTKEDRMNSSAVNDKARRLMEPVIGAARTAQVIERVNATEELRDASELVRLLASPRN